MIANSSSKLFAMKKILFLIVIPLMCLSKVQSQNMFDIVYSQNPSQDNRCGYFNSYFKNSPKEIGFSIQRENNKLYRLNWSRIINLDIKKFKKELDKNNECKI